jgi:hypothetical protein
MEIFVVNEPRAKLLLISYICSITFLQILEQFCCNGVIFWYKRVRISSGMVILQDLPYLL